MGRPSRGSWNAPMHSIEGELRRAFPFPREGRSIPHGHGVCGLQVLGTSRNGPYGTAGGPGSCDRMNA